jgi:hypothetical protein
VSPLPGRQVGYDPGLLEPWIGLGHAEIQDAVRAAPLTRHVSLERVLQDALECLRPRVAGLASRHTRSRVAAQYDPIHRAVEHQRYDASSGSTRQRQE